MTFHTQPFNKRSDFNDFTLIILGFVPVNVCSSHLQKNLFYFSYLFTVVFKKKCCHGNLGTNHSRVNIPL